MTSLVGAYSVLFLTFCLTCEGFYRKPYETGPTTTQVILPPKPQGTPKPFIPVSYKPAIDNGGSTYSWDTNIIYETLAPDVRRGGRNDYYSTGWGITFNIWIWIEVVPYTENYIRWYFRTTTIPSVVVVWWYTTEYYGSWGHQIRAYDDRVDEVQKKSSGLEYTCFSWQRGCDESSLLIVENYHSSGRMRSIGGGTDGTDNTLIAFIVIAVLIGAGIGGVMYYQKRAAAAMAEGEEGEGEVDGEAKEEPAEGEEKVEEEPE
ncbi:uncharacterized protein LOC122388544 [Amphibalanus amphitrite]|uniref:uncharacterized protein LOC122388544 n=1 Tax=Amphibalanus amphitrite TaxID=1232801 RepID=UPI001C910ACC|nr:uncharacterized protein LOC122388544 [Amphibalanus amphitrite]